MQVLGYVLQFILGPLSTCGRDGHDIKCADEVVRNCHFRVTGWLADQMENSLIHSSHVTRCAKCEAPRDPIGELQKYPVRDT